MSSGSRIGDRKSNPSKEQKHKRCFANSEARKLENKAKGGHRKASTFNSKKNAA